MKAAKIFYSYASEDKTYLEELEKQLAVLKQLGQIDTWHEGEMQPGTERENEIITHLERSDIILLLVSSNFFTSNNCNMVQERAMKLRKTKKTVVIPVLLSSVSGLKLTSIGDLWRLPDNGKAINKWDPPDDAYENVADGIYKVVEELRVSRSEQQNYVKDEFIFFGQYPVHGYRWDTDLCIAPGFTATQMQAPWLVSLPSPPGIKDPVQLYSLFNEKDLLRRFVRLSPTAEDIKEFADVHGYLGHPMVLYYPRRAEQSDFVTKDGQIVPSNTIWIGEPLEVWQQEIEEMNMLVTLWDLIQDRQIERLTKHIIWHQEPLGVRFEWRSPNRIRNSWIDTEWLSEEGKIVKKDKNAPLYLWEFGKVIEPAVHYLYTRINQKLEGHVNPTLFSLNKGKIYMQPDGLLSALYVLLAMEIREHPVSC